MTAPLEADTPDHLATRLAGLRVKPAVWSPPGVYDAAVPEQAAALTALLDSGAVQRVIDPLDELLTELHELDHPGTPSPAASTAVSTTADQSGYGRWVHFPWSGELVRYPAPDDHQRLRTARNRNLITAAEQAVLRSARIAVFGLSVGSNVVDQLAQGGIGGAFLIGDLDRLAPTNLNRLRATMSDCGSTKVDLAAIKLSEVDPWIEQQHAHQGFAEDGHDVLDEFRPDIIFEEVDDPTSKARIREWAARAGVPLVMVGDYGDRSAVDVERHDLGPVPPFNGRIRGNLLDLMREGTLTPRQSRQALIKAVGPRNLSVRLVESGLEVGRTLGGLPQLGSTAATGAALACVAARGILLGEGLESKQYVADARRLLGLKRQSGPLGALRTGLRLLKDRPA